MRGAEKFNVGWRGCGVKSFSLKMGGSLYMEITCREGEKDDTKEKISTCQCKQPKNLGRRRI